MWSTYVRPPAPFTPPVKNKIVPYHTWLQQNEESQTQAPGTGFSNFGDEVGMEVKDIKETVAGLVSHSRECTKGTHIFVAKQWTN